MTEAPQEQNHPETPDVGDGAMSQFGTAASQAPISGKRQAFDDVLLPLTPKDLTDPGTQKLILHMLQQARNDADQAEGYVERFHDADKRAAVLEEKLAASTKMSKAIEIAVVVGTTLGGVLMGFASYFWSRTPPDTGAGFFVLVCGLVLLVGGIAVKIAKR
jgi:hypothetical protein